MIASPMAVYTAELQGIRAVLVQAKDVQLELETKLKEVSFLSACNEHGVDSRGGFTGKV